jgi:DNA invertase Pin-like site-specific DNA recombinase
VTSHYLLYARKSSESEDRQALSIESQIRELTDYARTHNLVIAGVLSESRSAKTPGRPVFGELLRRLSAKEATGILCWKLDRLARNPIDGGAIIWAVDQGGISDIVVPGKSFSNRGDDKFWMQLEFGMAKKYVDDLSDNTKRGIRAKLEQGWLPGLPPLGYLNDVRNHTIVADPERFPIIRRVWQAILGGQSPMRVFGRLTAEWGLLTRPGRRLGSKPLTLSGFYRVLSNPFYHGLIIRKGESYPGAHEPMITKEEFDRAQEILGRPNRPPRRRHLFPFIGLIRCAECGCAITAEEVTNRWGSRYAYYRCSKRRRAVRCAQPGVRAEALEVQIVEQLAQLQVPDSLRDWVLGQVKEIAGAEVEVHRGRIADLAREYEAAHRRTADLLDLRLRGILSDAEFLAKKHELSNEEIRFKAELDRVRESPVPSWFDPARSAVAFASLALDRFQTATVDGKREIVLTLGSHHTLRDRILTLETERPFRLMSEGKGLAVGGDYHPIEPEPEPSRVLPDSIRGEDHHSRFQAEFSGVRTEARWGRRDQLRVTVGKVIDYYRQHHRSLPWPDFCQAWLDRHPEFAFKREPRPRGRRRTRSDEVDIGAAGADVSLP